MDKRGKERLSEEKRGNCERRVKERKGRGEEERRGEERREEEKGGKKRRGEVKGDERSKEDRTGKDKREKKKNLTLYLFSIYQRFFFFLLFLQND